MGQLRHRPHSLDILLHRQRRGVKHDRGKSQFHSLYRVFRGKPVIKVHGYRYRGAPRHGQQKTGQRFQRRIGQQDLSRPDDHRGPRFLSRGQHAHSHLQIDRIEQADGILRPPRLGQQLS